MPLALMYCMMRMRLLWMAVALAGAAPIALAQTGNEPEKRRSIPIGTSQDGSGPSDGALKGGSTERALDVGKSPQRAVNRCNELKGALQEECIRDLGLSATSSPLPVDALPTPPAYDIYADPRRRRWR